MSFALNDIFTTATSAPTSRTGITEIVPCAPLAPYVRCFWTYNGDGSKRVRIIPDCCADIIIDLHSRSGGGYCGVSNRSFISDNNSALFGIRFYAWGVRMFTNVDMSLLFNMSYPADVIFDGIGNAVSEIKRAPNTAARVLVAQKYLLSKLRNAENGEVMNSLYLALDSSCRATVNEMSDYCAVSRRTLERMFALNIGISPKQMTDMLRYQLLWQTCLSHDFDASDCVERFGYYDEAHLYNDFKKYHGIGLPTARKEFFDLS